MWTNESSAADCDGKLMLSQSTNSSKIDLKFHAIFGSSKWSWKRT
jgi:hypothetical protein